MEEFLLSLCLLLGMARLCGEIARRFHQPAVLGELVAGLLLGPSFLGHLAPEMQAHLFVDSKPLAALSLLGLCFLLVVTGLEIDLPLIGRKARSALWLSGGGLVIPLIFGFFWGLHLPQEIRGQGSTYVVAMFVAVALSISAIPVVAKVLMDLGALRSDLGQLILAAAMVDDAVGWMLLSVVVGLAQDGTIEPLAVAIDLGVTLGVLVFALVFAPGWMKRYLGFASRRDPSPRAQLSTVLLFILLAATATEFLGLEAGFGAFLLGVVLGQSRRLSQHVIHTLELITVTFFSPLFFASAGLKVDLLAILRPPLLQWFVLLMLVASAAKFLGCYLGGSQAKLKPVERLVVGAGLNPRGAMGVIVATVGLNLGVIEQNLYSLLVSMALLTSLIAPPMLRYFLQKAGPLEEPPEPTFASSLRRILLPTRGGENSRLAAELLRAMSVQQEIEVDTLVVGKERLKAPFLFTAPRFKVSDLLRPEQGSLEQTLVEVAGEGYDLLVLGASEEPQRRPGGALFEGVVDRVLRAAPCPIMVVRAPRPPRSTEVHKILVPVVGSMHSRHSVELASLLARSTGAIVHLLHVVPPPDDREILLEQSYHRYRREFAEGLLDSFADELRHQGLATESLVEIHASPEIAILDVLTDKFDLVILGSNLKPLSGSAFLGHCVERVLREADCTVLVLSSP